LPCSAPPPPPPHSRTHLLTRTAEEVAEQAAAAEARSRATVLEMLGDLPDAGAWLAASLRAPRAGDIRGYCVCVCVCVCVSLSRCLCLCPCLCVCGIWGMAAWCLGRRGDALRCALLRCAATDARAPENVLFVAKLNPASQ